MKHGMHMTYPTVIQSHTFWSLDANENLMTSHFFARRLKNSDFSRHFQFYGNIVQNACKISLEKVIRVYDG